MLNNNRMSKNKKNISGLSIIEALVSTVIVGIGFVAILQMTNFSVQSIDKSGDRTKANFLTEMIVEDVIGSKILSMGQILIIKILFLIMTVQQNLMIKNYNHFHSI